VRTWRLYVVLFAVALCGRVIVARFLANDEDQDGDLYAQIASNVLEHHIYSADTDPPFGSTLVRLPGYPLSIAGVYALFGEGNNAALFIVQGVLDTLTCVLVGMLAWMWSPEKWQKRRAALAAFLLAAACPFTAIYSAVLLTETITMFLSVAMVMAATFGFSRPSSKVAAAWWTSAGLLAGGVQLFRPDAGLFAAAIAFTIIGYAFIRLCAGENNVVDHFKAMLRQGGIFAFAYLVMLLPWTIRNACVFHIFEPLAPVYCNMPGDFVPRGYFAWFRTWADSERYLEPLYWSLGPDTPMDFDDVPPQAFDTESERESVAKLLERYNHPKVASQDFASAKVDDGSDDEEEQAAMTPDIDADFGKIARQRIAAAPLRYYVWLPIKRAIALWFVPHAQYYPFEGELFPLEEMDQENHQAFWLPVFFLLTLSYTIAGVAGAGTLWKTNGVARPDAIRSLLLAALLILPRWIYMATLEHTEPRYVVEFFPFLSVLGGIAISCFFGANQTGVLEDQVRGVKDPDMEAINGRLFALSFAQRIHDLVVPLIDKCKNELHT
jgi:Dolichyl-phosphate-mannose-protein mannosyltransferase